MIIDLNADLGEGCASDSALLQLVSSANIACGFHAGDPSIMRPLDRLLHAFVEQHRMKLPGGSAYEPCYRIVD